MSRISPVAMMVIVACLVVIVFGVIGIRNQPTIVGTWENSERVMTFKSDGTGYYKPKNPSTFLEQGMLEMNFDATNHRVTEGSGKYLGYGYEVSKDNKKLILTNDLQAETFDRIN